MKTFSFCVTEEESEKSMVIKTLDDVIKKLNTDSKKKKMVVVAAVDDHTLDAVKITAEKGYIEPVLIGPGSVVEEAVASIGGIDAPYTVIDIEDEHEMSQKAVDLIREGEADFLMKGKINTIHLLRPVMNDPVLNVAWNTGGVMSHISIIELPEYHKIFGLTDSGLNVAPDLNAKKSILKNAVDAFQKLGYDNPKVAVLCANEEVTPKQVETVDAAELQKLNESGEITGCTVCGPISMDLAMDPEAAALKGFDNPVAGDPDILLLPSLVAGNILNKALRIYGHTKVGSMIVGAKCPIVLASRSTSIENKTYSIILSAAMA